MLEPVVNATRCHYDKLRQHMNLTRNARNRNKLVFRTLIKKNTQD